MAQPSAGDPPGSSRRFLLQFTRGGAGSAARKGLLGLAGLFLFVLALQVMKAGADDLGGLVTTYFGVTSATSSLGFGWLFAYVVLSGSPVAAVALTFFASGVLNEVQTFTMIAGSRFGASFIVLFLGFVYMLRGRSKGQSLEMGVLSLLTTYGVYAIAVPLGALALMSGLFHGFHPPMPSLLFDAIEAIYGPIVDVLSSFVPPLLLFVVGLLTILGAFALFDKALPDLAEESPVRGLEAHVYRPMLMFALGAVLTLFTLSVSVSLGLLVPLSAKGIARRENVIPYIMGANITTFVDTLFATLFIGRPEAFTIVLVEMLSVAAVSLGILFLFYSRFERLLLATSRLVLASKAGLAVFLFIILLVPILLLFT